MEKTGGGMETEGWRQRQAGGSESESEVVSLGTAFCRLWLQKPGEENGCVFRVRRRRQVFHA